MMVKFHCFILAALALLALQCKSRQRMSDAQGSRGIGKGQAQGDSLFVYTYTRESVENRFLNEGAPMCLYSIDVKKDDPLMQDKVERMVSAKSVTKFPFHTNVMKKAVDESSDSELQKAWDVIIKDEIAGIASDNAAKPGEYTQAQTSQDHVISREALVKIFEMANKTQDGKLFNSPYRTCPTKYYRGVTPEPVPPPERKSVIEQRGQ